MNKFTVDLSALDVPEGTKWITQDKSGDVDFWETKPKPKSTSWQWVDGKIVDAHQGPWNPNWREAITKWPLPNKGHVHAKLMAEYAKDAMETDKPWERWEIRVNEDDTWDTPALGISFNDCFEYRRKPETVTINGQELLVSEVEEAKRLLNMNGLSRVAEALS